MPPEEEELHGKGAIQSEEDPRDWNIADRMASDGLNLAAAYPSSFTIPLLPPIIDQGMTPQCVAYSHSSMKAWHDHRDQKIWFNFNENLFFQQIGGTWQGAAARSALDRMKNYGYPVVYSGNPQYHKIAAYYYVPKDINMIKQALMSYGPLTMIGPWWTSWTNYTYSWGVLGGRWGTSNGHAFLIIGWDDAKGLYCQNSWGPNWAAGGRFWMPYYYVPLMWEIWKAVDQIVGPVIPSVPVITGDLDEMSLHNAKHQIPKIVKLKGGSILYEFSSGVKEHYRVPAGTTIQAELFATVGSRFLGRRLESDAMFFFDGSAIDTGTRSKKAIYS